MSNYHAELRPISAITERDGTGVPVPVTGEAAFFVDAGADRCQRCGDTNFTERRVCLTCSGDPSGATYAGGPFVVRDRRRVR